MTDDINRIIKCLTLSVEENEIKNLESLSWAINKLENFAMTFDTLDKSRIGQTLQSIRHSKKISADISGRIRNLIKCWRQLLNVDCLSVTPNAMKPPVNGVVKNGIVKENGFAHDDGEQEGHYFKPKRKPDKEEIAEEVEEAVEDKEADGNCAAEPPRTKINEENPLKMVFSFPISTQIGKPKLKSTKELLADFCSLINAETKNKILMDKITQEDDDPAAYHPQEFRQREMLQHQLLMQNNAALRLHNHEVIVLDDDDDEAKEEEPKEKEPQVEGEEKEPQVEGEEKADVAVGDKIGEETAQDTEGKENEIITEPSPAEPPKETKCDRLLRKFKSLCADQPSIVFRQLVPWSNMEKRGIDCSAPTIRAPKSSKRPLGLPNSSDEPPNKISITEIDDLLQTFETRAQRKAMITEAISRRKEEDSQFTDNTQSLTDVSLKLKLKLQKPLLKIRKRKIRKRKKKRKKKLKKKAAPVPPVPKPRVRKPRIKPKPPITNYLDDLPPLAALTTDSFGTDLPPEVEREEFPFSQDNVEKLVNGTLVEGRNCTKHCQTMELLDFRKMYSLLIGKEYLHVFPWVDLHYPTKSTFPTESDQMLQSALELPQLFS